MPDQKLFLVFKALPKKRSLVVGIMFHFLKGKSKSLLPFPVDHKMLCILDFVERKVVALKTSETPIEFVSRKMMRQTILREVGIFLEHFDGKVSANSKTACYTCYTTILEHCIDLFFQCCWNSSKLLVYNYAPLQQVQTPDCTPNKDMKTKTNGTWILDHSLLMSLFVLKVVLKDVYQ